MSIEHAYDVIVVGGGPAGMMAAGQAARRGLHVLLIEKNAVLGKKLSITGGGRCNVTNAEFDVRALLKHYGNAEQFLYSPFAQFGVQDTFNFFESHKPPLIVEDRKRAFPRTQKASDVVKVMEGFIQKHGVTVHTGTSVRTLQMKDGKITGVVTDKGIFTANAYILASGGKSHAETGSTGEGFDWLKETGHTVHASNPNLVPLVVKDAWVQLLSGTTLEHVRITFIQGAEKLVKQGNILCTHFGLSGPLILNSAHEVKEMLAQGNVQASIDLFPKEDAGALRTRLNTFFEEHQNKSLVNGLREWFPKGVVEAILTTFGEDVAQMKIHSIVRDVRHAVVDRMKNLSLTVTGTKGYDWAVVSDGGVDMSEIDTKTMRSKLHQNLYLVGDVLHVNRPSGGYSLQLCWTSGWVAGNNI